MILTEEQRGALAHAINYIDETDLPVGELDGFDREVLRAMIDSSDPIPDVTELVELLAAGEHEQWAVWAQAILDSEPGLSDRRKATWPEMIATPYENLSEELKDEDRRVVHLRSQAALDYIQQQSTEIERLRAALDESEQILAHKTKTSTHWYEEGLQTRADLVQCKRVVEQQAARIQELEDAHKRSGAKYAKIINELRSSVYANIPGLKKQWDEILNTPANDKIGPDADAKPREGLYGKYCISKADGSPVDPNADYFVLRLDTDPVARRAAREYSYVTPDRDLARGLQDRLAKYDPQLKDCMNIQFFGLEKPHCWQITEERKAALWHAINVLKENDIMEEPEGHLWDEEVTVLQAMLTEAGQE